MSDSKIENRETMKNQSKPKGRPKVSTEITSLVSLKGSTAFAEWLDLIVQTARCGTRNMALMNALEDYAKSLGITKKKPER